MIQFGYIQLNLIGFTFSTSKHYKSTCVVMIQLGYIQLNLIGFTFSTSKHYKSTCVVMIQLGYIVQLNLFIFYIFYK